MDNIGDYEKELTMDEKEREAYEARRALLSDAELESESANLRAALEMVSFSASRELAVDQDIAVRRKWQERARKYAKENQEYEARVAALEAENAELKRQIEVAKHFVPFKDDDDAAPADVIYPVRQE